MRVPDRRVALVPALLRSGGALFEECVERTKGPVAVYLANVQVLHGGLYAFMPQQLLQGDDIQAIFKQMCSIGMPQAVR